jgi:hypothetical protein
MIRIQFERPAEFALLARLVPVPREQKSREQVVRLGQCVVECEAARSSAERASAT